jgi:hypothetical protein
MRLHSRFAGLRRFVETYWAPAASAVLLFYVFTSADVQSLRTAASSFTANGLLTAFAAIVLGTMLACVRYAQVLKALGVPVPLRLAVRANLLGIVGGLLFFQIVGQTLARSAVLARQGVEGPAVLVANIMERITALIWLTALAGVSFLYMFGGSAFATLSTQQGLVKFLLTLAAALAVASVVTRRVIRPMLRGVRTRLLTGSGVSVGVLSFLVHQATLVAYVSLTSALAPDKSLLDIAAASAVVMFAASMPISFAGWGVRELSAVFVYQSIGIPVAEALTISVTVGLLSFAVVGVGGLVSQLLGGVTQTGNVASGGSTPPKVAHAIGRMTSLALPLLASVLIFFNARIPITGGALNLNLADPIAICGALIFAFRYRSVGWSRDAWQAPAFNLLIGIATLAMTMALLIGIWRFGYTDWAFFSRYVGWYILLAYVATGALIVGDAGEGGRHLMLDTMLAAGLSVCAVEFAATMAQTYGVGDALSPQAYPSGAAQNVNAYGVQLCILLCILFGYPSLKSRTRSWPEWALVGAIGLVLANVYFAHSRTAYIVSVAVAIAACVLHPDRRWTVAKAAPFAAILVALATIQIPISLGAATLSSIVETSPLLSMRVVHNSSDTERMQTILRGLELWREFPIFGAGLGAFAEEMRQSTGRIFVIHNTTVWMLAELGLAGGCAMIALFATIAVRAWKLVGDQTRGTPALILILALWAAALYQLPHDIYYQRVFWLVIGTTLFAGAFHSVRTVTPNLDQQVDALRHVLTSTGASVDSAPSHAKEEPQWRASRSRSFASPTRKA